MSTAPQANRPIPIKKDNLSKKEKKQTWRDKKEQRQKYLVTGFLAFVFGISSVAMFASNPFSGLGNPQTPKAGPSIAPEQAELDRLNGEINADKNNPLHYFSRGEAYYKQKKWREAAADYSKALELDPKDVMSMSHLGTVLLNQGKVTEAIPVLEKAAVAETEQVAARKAKGEEGNFQDINIPERLYQAYVISGQKDKAAAQLTVARQVDLMHVFQFLIIQSEQYYVEEDKKDIGSRFLQDGTASGAKIAQKLKDEFYPQAVAQFTLMARFDTKHPDKFAKVKAWDRELTQDLAMSDPVNAAKIAELLVNLEKTSAPQPIHASGSPQASTSAAPSAAPAAVSPSAAPASAASDAGPPSASP